MRTYEVKYQQSLLDIALQELGDVAGIVELARINNISITQDLEAGDVLFLPDNPIKPEIVNFYKSKGITLATDIPRPARNQFISTML